MWDEPDALIIGAGASGGAVAWSLAEAGFKVVCLEQGDWVEPDAMPHGRDDWEVHRLTDFNADPNVRQRPSDYPVNNAESTFAPLMFNAVGGSTIHWSAHFPRYHPSDFRVRSLDGVGDDWPLTYEELEPFYDLSDRITGVRGSRAIRRSRARSARGTPPLPIGEFGKTMAVGLRKAGLALVDQRRSDCLGGVRRAARVQSVRTVRPGLSDRCSGQRRCHVLAARAAAWRGIAHRVSGARDHR